MFFTIDQAKAPLDALIERSSAGEDVVITRDGQPVARMVAVNGSSLGLKNGTCLLYTSDAADE